jgi:hypothetical protein
VAADARSRAVRLKLDEGNEGEMSVDVTSGNNFLGVYLREHKKHYCQG